MAGYDKSRIVGTSDNDLDEFTCGICQDIFNNPVMTHCCRQTYCEVCIGYWLAINNTCPNDRQSMTNSDLSPVPRILINLLNKMQIKCEFEDNGCEVITTISELSKHVKECDCNPKNHCKACGLQKTLGEEHDCFVNLSIKNANMVDELERLRKENEELKKKTAVREMTSIIQSARNSINNFEIVGNRGIAKNIRETERIFLMETCQSAILNNDSFQSICDWLSSKVNRSLPNAKYWNVNAFSFEGGESTVFAEEYFRIKFSQVIIEIFTARLK